MAFTLAEAVIRFRGDPAMLLADARAQGGQAGARAGESFSEAFNEAGKRLIKGFIGAELILKSVDMLKDAVKAAREDQLVTAQLTETIKQNAQARADDTQRIEKQAAALKDLGFTDNEVKASLTALVRATGDLGRALSDQNIATDLARARHMSLADASQQLVMVEAGRYRGLAQLGIQIDAHATKEQALAAIRERVAGQSATFAATDEGAQARRDAAYDKLLETIGSKLTPILRDLANFETNVLIPATSAVADNLDKFAPILEGLAAALTIKVVGGFGAARLAALGFGSGLTTTAEVAVADGAVIEGTARGAASAWRTAIGVILILPEVMHLVGDAYETVRKTVFGANPVIQQWNEVLKGSTDGSQAQTDALGVLAGAQDKLTGAVGAGTTTTMTATEKAQKQTDATIAQAVADINAADALHQFGIQQGEIIDKSAAAAHQLDVVAQAERDAADAAYAAANPLSAEAAWLDHVAYSASVAAYNLSKIGTAQHAANTAAARALTFYGENTTGPGVGAALGAGNYLTNQPGTYFETFPNYVPPTPPRGRGGGGGGVSQAQKDNAATIRADMTTAYNAAKTAGDAFYDKMHQRILDHIAKVHQQATDEIAIERRKVNDWLAEEQRKNAAPVTEAERQLAALQHTRQMRNLQEAYDAAVAGGDPLQIRAAREAREEARLQEDIDALKVKQAADDAIAAQTAKAQELALDARQKAADDGAKIDADKENEEAPKRKKRFDDALADWYRHLTAVKGHHKSALKDLDDLWTKFGLDGKAHGKKFGTELAAGLKGEIKAVETAAESLAEAVKKYIKVGSPAEKGPLRDNPPDVMGAKVGRQWIEGVRSAVQGGGPALNATTQGVIGAMMPPGYNPAAWAAYVASGQAGAAETAQAGQVAITNPVGYDPSRWGYYQSMGGAKSGLPYDQWLASIASGDTPNEFGMTPQDYAAAGAAERGPGYYDWSGHQTAAAEPYQYTPGNGGPQITVHVNNPRAEAASTSTARELQLLAATGVLGG